MLNLAVQMELQATANGTLIQLELHRFNCDKGSFTKDMNCKSRIKNLSFCLCLEYYQ